MMQAKDQASDLGPRVITGAILATICLGAIWFGGTPLLMLAVALAGLMCWELARLIAPTPNIFPILFGLGAGVAVFLAAQTTGPWGFAAITLLLMAALWQARGTWKPVIIAYSIVVLAASLAIFAIRDTYGIAAFLWLVFLVIATDTAGYFVGRSFGGPKFWPAVSPKKTWSGVIGGWIAAVIVSVLMASSIGLPIWAAVFWGWALSFASQMGDIAESAIKRRAGVKDSSSLLPGHGGFLDRFDAMIAVLCLAFVFKTVIFGAA